MRDPLLDAACAGKSEIMEGRDKNDRAFAVEICATCPLATQVACDDLARSMWGKEEISGIWASTWYGETYQRTIDGKTETALRKPRRLGVPLDTVENHGTSTGRRYGCRCEPCLDYERAKSAKQRAEKDAAA